ncbi:MAG TPA: NAD(+)/NADH kinase [Terriglobia bacterium]|nr:NAD(+)/NADH kinase [Terriglobia bacterium]
MNKDIRRIGIIAKPKLTTVSSVVHQLIEWCAGRQIQTLLDKDTAPFVDQTNGLERYDLVAASDLIVVLGGDGTLLSVARVLDSHSVPILAVNFGSLGFLTEITLEEMFATLESVLAGKATTQARIMIDVSVLREGRCFEEYRALNDAVLTKGALARIIDIDVNIADQFVATYKADGLIVSTPTGSTAYALSAGGPIVYPTLGAMLVTPIASHTLTFRALVVPDGVTIEMSLKATQESVYLTVDGQIGLALKGEDRIRVRKSAIALELIESSNKNFFDILRGKLKWGER